MYRIGIDLGGTNMVAGLVDERLQIVDKCSVKTNVPRSIEAIVEDMVQLVGQLTERNRISSDDLICVGVGVPCTANPENGHMEDANNLGFDDTPFLSLLQARLSCQVCFENDANAAAWGEYISGNDQDESLVMVTVGTGIGGGIILNGKLWSGINGAAAEFGHMTIHHDGVLCSCGRRGCFEAMASGTALIARTRERMKEHLDSLLWEICDGKPENIEAKSVFDGAMEGDRLSLELLDAYTTYLAEGIANIINIFQPAVLRVGGGVSWAGDALLLPLREKTAELICSKNAKRNTRIELAKLGNDAGVLGAALLGIGR